jgi:hypothetical protein
VEVYSSILNKDLFDIIEKAYHTHLCEERLIFATHPKYDVPKYEQYMAAFGLYSDEVVAEVEKWVERRKGERIIQEGS